MLDFEGFFTLSDTAGLFIRKNRITTLKEKDYLV